jgi:hypothetical protein
MSGLNPLTDEDNKNSLEWPKVLYFFGIAFILFILTSCFFVDFTKDITDYMDDHHAGFDQIEFFVIIGLLIAFYIVPSMFIGLVKKVSSKSYNIVNAYHFYINISFALALIAIIYILFPYLSTTHGPEGDGLRKIAVYWLFSILIINILIEHEFEDRCVGYIEKILINIKRNRSR